MRGARALGGVLLGLSACSLPMSVHAQQEIFRCRSTDGQVTYTNDRRQAEKQKCTLVSSERVNVAPSAKFPRETRVDNAKAKGRQREILEKELKTEEQALTKARQALAEQQAVREGDEKNYARVLERLQPYQETVQNHEKNIQALQRELGNLK